MLGFVTPPDVRRSFKLPPELFDLDKSMLGAYGAVCSRDSQTSENSSAPGHNRPHVLRRHSRRLAQVSDRAARGMDGHAHVHNRVTCRNCDRSRSRVVCWGATASPSWQERAVRSQADELGCSLSHGVGNPCIADKIRKTGLRTWLATYGKTQPICFELSPLGLSPRRRTCG
jgi:hypothetical protein